MREATTTRTWASCAVLVLASCSSGQVINAGTNDGGQAPSSGEAGVACPTGYVCTPAQTPGVTSIATQIQLTPTNMVSDGTWLYWVSGDGPGGPVSRVPVGGGAVSSVVPGPVPGGFIAIDDTNVYYLGQTAGLYTAPKGGGGTPAPVSGIDAASAGGFTVLGTQVYWAEIDTNAVATIKKMPLRGGSVAVVATLDLGFGSAGAPRLGVTASTVFISTFVGLKFFPLSTGVPDGGVLASVTGLSGGCQQFLASDTSAIYCGSNDSVVAVADDGTTTTLGQLVIGGSFAPYGGVAFDDTNVYWTDQTMVGTIMKAPKNGGSATVVARDTSPLAIAVDANAVYWSDAEGNILRIAK